MFFERIQSFSSNVKNRPMHAERHFKNEIHFSYFGIKIYTAAKAKNENPLKYRIRGKHVRYIKLSLI